MVVPHVKLEFSSFFDYVYDSNVMRIGKNKKNNLTVCYIVDVIQMMGITAYKIYPQIKKNFSKYLTGINKKEVLGEFIYYSYLSFILSSLDCASVCPCSAALLYHFIDSESSCGTPMPSLYISPRLNWADVFPCFADLRYHLTASA